MCKFNHTLKLHQKNKKKCKFNIFSLDKVYNVKYNVDIKFTNQQQKGQKMKFGYCRVSTEEQNLDRQLKEMKVDRLYCDKKSGKNTDRPELQALLMNLREGDQIECLSLDRLSRNLKDVINLIETINGKGCVIHFIKEGFTFTPNKNDPFQKLMLSMLGAINEFYRTNQLEIQRAGIQCAKEKGKYKKPRRKKLNADQITEIKQALEQRISSISQLAKKFGISRVSLYKYIRQ